MALRRTHSLSSVPGRSLGILLLLLSLTGAGLAQGGHTNPRDTKDYGKTPVSGNKEKQDPAPEPVEAPAEEPVSDGPTDLLVTPAPGDPPVVGPDGEIIVPPPLPQDSRLLGTFAHTGAVREGGVWTLDSSFYQDDQVLQYEATLTVKSAGLWYWMERTQGVYLVVLGERLFDGDGDYRYGASGLGTTLLTPTGLPVATGNPHNPTDAFGGALRHPGNRMMLIAPAEIEKQPDQETFIVRFRHTIPVGEEFLPGWYRFSAQFGIQLTGTEFTTLLGANPAELSLNSSADSIARYPLTAVKTAALPTLPITLFPDQPNGGALPERLKSKIGLLTRQTSGPKTILPPFEANGGQRQYVLDAAIPFLQESGTPTGAFPLSLATVGSDSHLAMSLQTPDKTVLQLGDNHILGVEDGLLKTDRMNNTFAFSRFGKHVLTVTGQLTDGEGQQYKLDGTYDIHVAMPIDLRVATLPGLPALEKEAVSLATRVYPPVPAKIIFTQWLAVHGSDRVFRWIQDGWCNDAGEYLPELRKLGDGWMGPGNMYFENDGEYRILAEASFTGSNGWEYLGQWESANVVMPPAAKSADGDESLGLLPAFGGLGATSNPNIDRALDFPLLSGELLFIPPGQNKFDPRLYGRGETSLIDSRLLPASSMVDLTNGERGFLPTSATPQGYPAGTYPESRDRAGRLYAWAVAPGEPARMVIRDGEGDAPDALVGPSFDWPAGSTWMLYGGVSVFDHKLKEAAQGGYSGGLVVSDRIARFSVLPPGSGADELIGRAAPFVLQSAIAPGMIVDQFKAYTPQMQIFPPRAGDLKVTLKRPDATEEYFEVAVDSRGFGGRKDAGSEIEQAGVYTVSPSLMIDGALMAPPPYQFYVPNRKSGFKMTLNEAPMMPLDWDGTLTLSGQIAGEGFRQAEFFWTFLANGQVVTQSQQAIASPDFRLSLDLPAALKVPGFDPQRPGHVGDITLFAVILTDKGEIKTAHQRVALRHGMLDYVIAGPAKKKKPFDIF